MEGNKSIVLIPDCCVDFVCVCVWFADFVVVVEVHGVNCVERE